MAKTDRLTHGRIARVGADVWRYRATYPAIRLKPLTQLPPARALNKLGFDDVNWDLLEADFAQTRRELFPALLERGRTGADPSFVRKLENPELPAHEGVHLLYLTVRALRPAKVVETGTFSGFVSSFILRALDENAAGELVSLDLPARTPIRHAVDHALPENEQPGWMIPDVLRSRFRLVVGDARLTLKPTLEELGEIDLFLHDSLHTTSHMLFEYRTAWKALRPLGLLISDDIFMTPAYWWFIKRHRLPFVHVGNVGVTRKPH